LIDFDHKLIEIFSQRRDRYIKLYYPGLDFDDFEEGQHDEEVSRKKAEDF
jgi:hypothetical protein